MNEELERLRAKAELYRRLFKDTVDAKTLVTLRAMADELENEIAEFENKAPAAQGQQEQPKS